MNDAEVKVERRSRSQRLKEAVIASFWEPAPSLRARFAEFNHADWKKAMYWLDVSGLALYLFDRLQVLDLQDCLPSSVRWRLKTNLAENRQRIDSLFTEAVTISRLLTEQNVACALLKGASLPPESVPDGALRCQADLDMLICAADGAKAQRCLESLGYKLHAVSGTTWELKAGPFGTGTLKDIYSVRPERALDLHLLEHATPRSNLLGRGQLRFIQGVELPVLSAADIFVQQAVHLFKHMCSEFTRAAWVLEFWRHTVARRNDAAFWHEVEVVANEEPHADLAIGAALLMTSLIFGPCTPEPLSRWTLDRLSPAVCLWIQMYGRHILLSDSPRSKLYLLLLRQLQADSPDDRAARRRLIFPIHLPPRVTHAAEHERIPARLRRYRTQAHFVMTRLGFHTAEGLRLAFESFRWQRRLAEVMQ